MLRAATGRLLRQAPRAVLIRGAQTNADASSSDAARALAAKLSARPEAPKKLPEFDSLTELRAKVNAHQRRADTARQQWKAYALDNPKKAKATVVKMNRVEAKIENGKVQVPLVIHGMPGRYATALYRAAAKAGKATDVEVELEKFQILVNRFPTVADFCHNPTIQRRTRVAGMIKLSDQAKFSSITKNFFCTLADNGRTNKLDKIIDAFKQIMRAHRGEVKAMVTTAHPLTKQDVANVRASLQELVEKDQKILLSARVNPHIFGGMVIKIGDRQIDM